MTLDNNAQWPKETLPLVLDIQNFVPNQWCQGRILDDEEGRADALTPGKKGAYGSN